MVSLVSSTVSLLFRKHLFATNLGVSFGLSALGDAIQQVYEQREKGFANTRLDMNRMWCMSAGFGLTSGVLCHHWYNYLDRVLPGRGMTTVVKKIAFDQLLFSPVCISTCMVTAGVLEGSDADEIFEEVVYKGIKLYAAEWVIWPPAQFINFYFLPTRYRVIFDNTVSLIYDVYTSYVKNNDIVRAPHHDTHRHDLPAIKESQA